MNIIIFTVRSMNSRGSLLLMLVQASVQSVIIVVRSLKYQPYAQTVSDKVLFACIALIIAFCLSSSLFRMYGSTAQKELFWELLTNHVPVSTLWLVTLQPFLLLLSALKYRHYQSNIAEEQLSELLYGLIVAPVAEEVMYRLMVEALFQPLDYTPIFRVIISDSFFALLHFLTIRDRYRFAQNWIAKISTLFNTGLTVVLQAMLFGVWSEMMLAVTRSIWPSIIIHSICNYIGPPRMITSKDWYINAIGLCCFLLDIILVCELHGVPVSQTLFVKFSN